MEEHKISVIIPVYKVEAYLPRCLDSVINQTYKNLEIILVDDGSPDNSGKICDEYAEKDSRIRVIHQENKGVAEARNVGLEVATGEYIIFADSDDWLEYDMYEVLIQKQTENNADIAYCGFYIEKETTEESNLPNSFTEDRKAFQGKVINTGWLYSVLWNKMIKRSVIDGIRFNKILNCSEDSLFLYEISKNVNSVYFFNRSLYHYNKMNENAITTATDFSESLLYVREFFVNDVKNDKELYEIAVMSLMQSYVMLINWSAKTKNADKYEAWIKRLKPYKKDIFHNRSISERKKALMFLLFYFKHIYYILCIWKSE